MEVQQEIKEDKLTPAMVAELMRAVPTMSPELKRSTLEKIRVFKKNWVQEHGKDNFLDFIAHVYPGYMVGAHHRKLSQIFEDIAAGKKKRVIVNIAPPGIRRCNGPD